MSTIDRKKLVREYKETARPAGVYRIHNTAGGISLIGSCRDLPAMMNRVRFQLNNGLHPDRDLQRDWRELGGQAFKIEVLDELKPSKEPDYDPGEDLDVLLGMWIDKLTATGERLYGPPRKNAV